MVGLTRIKGEKQRFPAVILNISEDGFAFSSFIHLPVGERVALILAPDIMFDGVVIWENGIRTGCEFDPPISPDQMRQIGHVA